MMCDGKSRMRDHALLFRLLRVSLTLLAEGNAYQIVLTLLRVKKENGGSDLSFLTTIRQIREDLVYSSSGFIINNDIAKCRCMVSVTERQEPFRCFQGRFF